MSIVFEDLHENNVSVIKAEAGERRTPDDLAASALDSNMQPRSRQARQDSLPRSHDLRTRRTRRVQVLNCLHAVIGVRRCTMTIQCDQSFTRVYEKRDGQQQQLTCQPWPLHDCPTEPAWSQTH